MNLKANSAASSRSAGNAARITILSAADGPSITTGTFGSPAKNGGYLTLDVLWETENLPMGQYGQSEP